jgi:mono/diheme cytochrome c family protein
MRPVIAFAALVAALALVAAGCGGGSDESASPPATTTETTTTTATETTTTSTEPTTTGGTAGDPANGEKVFASAGCGGCHTFSKAGSSGSVGPNLDDLSPSFDTVVRQVTNGGGPMPAFKDQLTEQEIRDVAAFVSGSSS